MTDQTSGAHPADGELAVSPLAVVTGGSSGIGLELAREFATHGYDLLIAAAGPRLEEAALELAELGVEVQASQVDLSTYNGVEQLYGTIRSLGRPVEAVAINAGVGVTGDFARETELQQELHLIQLNVASSVHLAKRVISDMVDRGRGRVLFTSSASAGTPRPFEAVYVASKAFISSFAAALRSELAGTGVTVTALFPGPTDTDFAVRAGMTDTSADQGEKQAPAQVARLAFQALVSGQEAVVAGPPPSDHQVSP